MQEAAPLPKVRPHSLAGSVPAVKAVQAPRLPATLQAWQAPPHAPLQQ